MRSSQFINNVIGEIAKNEGSYSKMRGFSHENFKDGWEIWLQCEAYSFLPDSRQYVYSRGNPYPVPFNNKKCDFLLRRDNVSLWLELKVLLKQDMRSLIDRFTDDLNKIFEIDIPEATNSIGAFVVVPLDAPLLFSQEIKLRFIERSSVNISDINFLAVRPGVANLKGPYNSNPQITNNHVVILYYVRI